MMKQPAEAWTGTGLAGSLRDLAALCLVGEGKVAAALGRAEKAVLAALVADAEAAAAAATGDVAAVRVAKDGPRRQRRSWMPRWRLISTLGSRETPPLVLLPMPLPQRVRQQCRTETLT